MKNSWFPQEFVAAAFDARSQMVDLGIVIIVIGFGNCLESCINYVMADRGRGSLQMITV